MLIYKILNNNAVVSKDSKNREIIVMGNGIAFKKSRYDEVEDEKISQIFVPKNAQNRTRLEMMVSEIPYDYFEISEEIKNMAEERMKCKLDDGFSIRLCDHIYYSIDKYSNHIFTPNLMLNELKQFYAKEFEVAKIAVEMIKNKFGVLLNEDEIGFITFHIVTSEDSVGLMDINEIVSTLSDIIALMEDYFPFTLNRNSNDYQRLLTHLKFFLSKVMIEKKGNESKLGGDPLFEMLIEKYSNINKFLDKLNGYMMVNYNYKITDSDRMYLIIHLARCME